MTFRALMLLCLTCAMCGLSAPAALAADRGPLYEEDDDAGSLPANAKKVEGSGSLQAISGSLTGNSRGEGDYQDMYEVYIAHPGEFLLKVTEVSQGLNTQLFLFDPEGRGMLANDDSLVDNQPSPNAELPNASTDGTNVVLKHPGAYYIAISGTPSRPVSQEGPIFSFNPDTPFEVSGPDGQGGTLPIFAWGSEGDTGSYVISLTGVNFLPPAPGACCLTDGTCVEVDEANCEGLGGNFSGSGVSCGTVNCSVGACCFLKEYCWWECLQLSEQDCATRYAATWHGPGSKCEDIDCPDLCYGACCVNGGCVLTIESLCDAQEGVFHAYSMCADIECQSGDDDCPGDINGDSTVNILDLLKVIEFWGNCP